MSYVRVMALVVVVVLVAGAGCDSNGGGWGFRSFGKRDASDVNRPRSAAR